MTTTQNDAAKAGGPAGDDCRVDPVDEQLVRELAERARAEGVRTHLGNRCGLPLDHLSALRHLSVGAEQC